MDSNRPRLLYITTSGSSAISLMRGQLNTLRERGFDITLIASPSNELEIAAKREGVDVIPIPMTREISPWADFRSLRLLTKTIRQLKPDIVNAGTPKAGLLGMLASRKAGVPARIYTLRGLRLETTTGWKQRLLSFVEKTSARCAHKVVCVSDSLRSKYLELGLAEPDKCVVLGHGSSNGVDVSRFEITDQRHQEAAARRKELGIPSGCQVIGFLGRMTRDKGIEELARAFWALTAKFPNLRLLLVGDFENGDPVAAKIRKQLSEDPHVHITGIIHDPENWYPLMDVVAYPSYREGFPNVPLEAGAARLPIVGYRATGTVDAIQDGVTGTLTEIADEHGLATALESYLADPSRCRQHGDAGYERVAKLFRNAAIWDELANLYDSMLGQKQHFDPAATMEQKKAA